MTYKIKLCFLILGYESCFLELVLLAQSCVEFGQFAQSQVIFLPCFLSNAIFKAIANVMPKMITATTIVPMLSDMNVNIAVIPPLYL